MVKRTLLPILSLLLSTSCMVEKGEVNIKLPGAKNFRNSEITKATVTNVQIINDQLVITGTNLNVVTNIKTENASKSFSESFTIESKSNSQIIANSNSPLSFAVNSLFNLVLSNSYGAATFQINFSLCDATINGKGINCSVVANDKDVLSYDSLSDTWKPRQVNGLNYLGTFDASPGIAPTAQPSGSYYVISVSGTIGAINFDVGDWIVSNGSAYQKIDNSTAIISVFGRTGAVSGVEGDYSLDLLSDVDLLTTPPTAGKILKYNGTQWVVSDDLSSGGAGSVSSSEIADGTIATADLANASVTDAKINSVAASKITGTLTGTQIGTGVITNSHIAAGAAIDYTKLNITNNTIPYAHINVGAGEIAQDRIAGFSTALANLLTGTITNGDTTHAPTGDAVFDALGLKLNLTGGTLSVGTINGVPTPVNGDDIVNKAYVDSAVTGATTTANDKVSKTGDTMTGALVLPANGLTVGTNQLKVNGGNVGIGTASPSAPLHIVGGGTSYANALIVDSSAASGGSTIILGNNATDGDQVRIGVNGFLRSQTGLFGLDTTSPTAPLAFSVNSNEKMRILNSGNVGIGTSSPAEKLDVVGNINATQLCIGGDCKSAWPTGLSGSSVGSTEITDGSIVNADINAGAAIAQSKIAGLTTDLSNKQPLDAGLTNLSSFNTNGILVQSADNTFVGRSIAGTANRVDITNGDGVAGNPTININPTLLPSPTASGYFLKSTGADASVWSLLSSGDITTALGFTPVNKSGDTISTGTIAFNAIGTLSLGYTPTNLTDATSKSYVDNLVATAANQWTESSGNIYRNSGNVGIGTASPLVALQVTSAKFSSAFPVNSFLVDNAAQAADIGGGVAFGGYGDNASTTPIAFGAIRAGKENSTSGNYLGYLSLMYRNQSLLQEGMRISSSGNVGIGTASPANKLHIANTTAGGANDPTLVIESLAAGGEWLDIGVGTSGSIISFSDTGFLSISKTSDKGNVNTGDTEFFRITNTGNVGIGTISPSAKLEVKDTNSTSTVLYVGDSNTNGSTGLYFNRWAAGTNPMGIQGTIAGVGAGDITLQAQGGNVGIGTTSPRAPLDIATQSGAGGNIRLGKSSATEGGQVTLDDGTGVGAWEIDVNGSDGNELLRFFRDKGENNIVNALNLAPNGFIGVGTSTPVTTLDIISRTPTGALHPDRAGLIIRSENTDVGGRIEAHVASATESPLFMGMRSRGTLAAPTAVQLNDSIAQLIGFGHDGSTYLTNGQARINFSAEQNWTTGSAPTFITFGTTPVGSATDTEKMRITSAGNIGIGTTQPGSALEIFRNFGANTEGSSLLLHAGNSGVGNGSAIDFKNTGAGYYAAIVGVDNNTFDGRIDFRISRDGASTASRLTAADNAVQIVKAGANGPFLKIHPATLTAPPSGWGGGLWTWDAYVEATFAMGKNGATNIVLTQDGNGSMAGTLTQSSDERLKEEIKSIDHSLEKLMQLDGVYYFWKNRTPGKDTKQIGLIAQDVQKVFPEAVRLERNGYLAVAYQNLVGPIINSIKEIYRDYLIPLIKNDKNQDRKIASLEKENALLKEKDAQKEKELKALKDYLCQKDPKAPICSMR